MPKTLGQNYPVTVGRLLEAIKGEYSVYPNDSPRLGLDELLTDLPTVGVLTGVSRFIAVAIRCGSQHHTLVLYPIYPSDLADLHEEMVRGLPRLMVELTQKPPVNRRLDRTGAAKQYSLSEAVCEVFEWSKKQDVGNEGVIGLQKKVQVNFPQVGGRAWKILSEKGLFVTDRGRTMIRHDAEIVIKNKPKRTSSEAFDHL